MQCFLCLKSVLWERVETLIWKTVELHIPKETKASFIIGSNHIQQWQTLILKPLKSCSQSPCYTSINNIYTLISVPDAGSLYTRIRKDGKMQSVLPSSLTVIIPTAKRARLRFGNLSRRPHQSTVAGDIQYEKRIWRNGSDGLPCGASDGDFYMAGQ